MTHSTYDVFSSDYDRFVNWKNRLAFEIPFLTAQLNSLGEPGQLSVLDAACGTGMHAVALAQLGYRVAGADLSQGMIERARANAAALGLAIPFHPLGFGQLSRQFPPGSFDALLCLGNSLPHLLTPPDLAAALRDFATCLKSGGLLIIQNRNFDAVLATRERWMDPQSQREADKEWLFLRLYDYLPDGLIDFHIIILHREGNAPWRQQVSTTRLYPLRSSDLATALLDAGFEHIILYGGLNGSPFDPSNSGNLVITARKA